MTVPSSLLRSDLLDRLSRRWELGRVVRNKVRGRYSDATAREISDVLGELAGEGLVEVELRFDPEEGVAVAAYRRARTPTEAAALDDAVEELLDAFDFALLELDVAAGYVRAAGSVVHGEACSFAIRRGRDAIAVYRRRFEG